MNLADLKQYAQNPSLISSTGVKELEMLVKDYPYFSTAQILLAKGMNNNNSIRYVGQLKLAACYIGERTVLFNLIKSKPLFEKNDSIISEYSPNENKYEQTIEKEPTKTVETFFEKNTEIEEKVVSELENEQSLIRKDNDFDDLLEFDYSDSLKFDYEYRSGETTTKLSGLSGSGDYFASNKEFLSENNSNNDNQEQIDKNSIIDKFLEKNPRIIPKNAINVEEEVTDISENSVAEQEYLTETLAKIYLKQKNYDKAMKIYQKLSLKFPQKSIYFADQILQIKNLKK